MANAHTDNTLDPKAHPVKEGFFIGEVARGEIKMDRRYGMGALEGGPYDTRVEAVTAIVGYLTDYPSGAQFVVVPVFYRPDRA